MCKKNNLIPLSANDRFSKNNSELLDIIFNHSLDSIALLDTNLNFLKVNQSFGLLCKKNIGFFKGKNYLQTCNPLAKKLFQNAVLKKTAITWFARPYNPDNSKQQKEEYWDWRVVPILNANKQVEMLLLSIKDVTVQQQAFEEIVSLSRFPAENPNPVLRISINGKVLYNNLAVYEIAKKHNAENNLKLILPKGLLADIQKSIKHNKSIDDLTIKLKNKVYSYNIMPVPSQGYVNIYGRDITDIKNTQKVLEKTEKDLLEQQKVLQEKNIALSIVLEQIQKEKENTKRDIANNIKQVVFPVWEKLKYAIKADPHVALMDKALKDIATPYSSFLIDSGAEFSARELEVCYMIQSGFSSKEIGKVLNISEQTVEKHRAHIRCKLKLNNKRQNLSTYLRTKPLPR